jgi:hypothetical protein
MHEKHQSEYAPTKIRIHHLLDTNTECYCYNSLFERLGIRQRFCEDGDESLGFVTKVDFLAVEYNDGNC